MSILDQTQSDTAIRVLKDRGIVRAAELRDAGVAATTLSRLERLGKLVRLERGLYQLANVRLDTHHSLAEVAAAVDGSVVCLVSALALHGLTDRLPRRVWLAVSYAKRRPTSVSLSLRIVRMSDRLLERSVQTRLIERVPVRVFSPAKTVADCFRLMRLVGRNTAIEGLREALQQRRASPAELAEEARACRIWTVMRPYLEALTASA
ncbi:MAG: type IV toxin-antitoxin system AbiEi family antitoxin domain-containing protein [Clostridia bacterium]|nr:type IV toxin-antitoxin system AbiEi family antitoxin domain-containing protein [Deltaproteobacteria bacterium]